MSLSVSVNGGDRVPARHVVLFDDGIPIAAAMQHGNIVIFADSVRDYEDIINILDAIGVKIAPARRSDVVIKGSL